ncbi:hypothetical protein TRAPUB_4677 [Trametes pubescens]|uniref:Uncharacterized protein n=1 Tax=Trametes pubescens TaxID=154538 RepID=A0A1M2VAK5_TRAPU|nr:hypothetical protein TRAPUB_4677 [Trametes pubescens]
MKFVSTSGSIFVISIQETMESESTLMDYAVSPRCGGAIKPTDFVGKVKTFLNQLSDLDTETVLYAVFSSTK